MDRESCAFGCTSSLVYTVIDLKNLQALNCNILSFPCRFLPLFSFPFLPLIYLNNCKHLIATSLLLCDAFGWTNSLVYSWANLSVPFPFLSFSFLTPFLFPFLHSHILISQQSFSHSHISHILIFSHSHISPIPISLHSQLLIFPTFSSYQGILTFSHFDILTFSHCGLMA